MMPRAMFKRYLMLGAVYSLPLYPWLSKPLPWASFFQEMIFKTSFERAAR